MVTPRRSPRRPGSGRRSTTTGRWRSRSSSTGCGRSPCSSCSVLDGAAAARRLRCAVGSLRRRHRGDRRDGRRRRRRISPPRPGSQRSSPAPFSPWWFATVRSCRAEVGSAGAGLAVILVCAMSWPAAGGPATAGWLPAFALASVALIGGLQRPSLVRTVLSIAPLVWLGRISYGVYLFHWPIYTLVDERRFDVGSGGPVRGAAGDHSRRGDGLVLPRRVAGARPAECAGGRLAAVAAGACVVIAGDRRCRARPQRHLHLRRRGDAPGCGDRAVRTGRADRARRRDPSG